MTKAQQKRVERLIQADGIPRPCPAKIPEHTHVYDTAPDDGAACAVCGFRVPLSVLRQATPYGAKMTRALWEQEMGRAYARLDLRYEAWLRGPRLVGVSK